jgi:polyisoprenoid-binding protein YceI
MSSTAPDLVRPAGAETGALPAAPTHLIPDGTWTIDAARSAVGFAVRELRVMTVRGRFGDVTGTLYGGDTPHPLGRSIVGTASIDTGTRKRDEHLRSPDFLDSDTYPEMTLIADHAEPQLDGTHRVAGELTIKGATRPVELSVDEHEATADRLKLRATGRIHRYDFGVKAPKKAVEAGGFLIGREVDLDVRIEATRD